MARSKSPLYKVHYQFLKSCTDPNYGHWKTYGGKGIKLYRPWASYKTGFDNFEAWVLSNLGPKPHKDSLLKRIDSTKDIKPGNLMWSNKLELSNNRITNIKITIKKQTRSLSDWIRIYKLPYETILSRIHHGWPPKVALETPLLWKRK